MSPPWPDRPRQLLVAGHINVDRFLRVARFPEPDRTVPVQASRDELGGTATNIARTATRYGVPSGLVARIGRGFPPELRTELERTRVDVRGVQEVASVSTPTCYIVEDAHGQQRTLIDQGAMREGAVGRLPLGPWLREYAWLHVTTGPPDLQLAIVAAARRAGLRVAADPAQEIHYRWGARPLSRLLAASEVLFGNRHEIARAAELMGGRGPASLLAHVPLVVQTEGPRGAVAWSRAGTVTAAARRPRRVRTVVGAGDAFRGGFYAGWFAGRPLAGCLLAGNRAARAWLEGRR
jgi:nucleoside kinase